MPLLQRCVDCRVETTRGWASGESIEAVPVFLLLLCELHFSSTTSHSTLNEENDFFGKFDIKEYDFAN